MSKLVEHLNGLKKVELSGLVELGFTQDLASALSIAKKETSIAETAEKKLLQIVSDSISAYKQARVKATEGLKIYNELVISYKEIGVPLDAKISQVGTEMKAILDNGLVKIQKLQTIK